MRKSLARRKLLKSIGVGFVAAGGAGATLAQSHAFTDVEEKDDDTSATIASGDYCVEDGKTDDGPNIQRAADALVAHGGGELIFTPGKRYYWNTDVLIEPADAEVKIRMKGAKIIAGPSAVRLLTIAGTREPIGDEDAFDPTQVGDTSLTTSKMVAEHLSAGDMLMVWSSNPDNGERPTDYMSGEESVVADVKGPRIVLDQPLRFDHTSKAERRIFKFAMAPRPVIEGGIFVLHPRGSRQVAITLDFALRPQVKDVHVSGKSGRYGVHINQCIEPQASDITGINIYDAANGTAPNGVALYFNGVIGGTAWNVKGERCRHAVDINSFSSRRNPGLVSRDVTVSDAKAICTYGPGFTTHHVRDVTFVRPVSIDCGGGGQIRGYDSKLFQPRIKGGNLLKPPEWDAARYVTAGLAFGETDSLDQGKGIAALKVLIDRPRIEDLPEGWTGIAYSDDPRSVTITGS